MLREGGGGGVENGRYFKIKSMPLEYLFSWSHRLHTKMVEKAGFWSYKVQVQGPSYSRGRNRCEFELLNTPM